MASEIYLLFIHFVLLLSVYDMTVAIDFKTPSVPRIALPGCQDHCGTVRIPYPFGIGKGCYKNEWYSVQCGKGSVPFLRKTHLKVIEISFGDDGYPGFIMIEYPAISVGCFGAGASKVAPLNLTGSPFFISSENTFVALGCNNSALLTDLDQNILWCLTTCNHRPRTTLCANSNCCTTRIPRLQVLAAKIENTDANRGKCLVAYLDYFVYDLLNASDRELRKYSKAHFKVRIEWYMHGPENEMTDSKEIPCIRGTVNKNLYHCWCKGGSGNPYVRDGCKAVRDSPGINRIITLVIGIGIVLPVLSAGAVIWQSCRAVKKLKRTKLKKKFFQRNGGLLLQQQLSTTQGSIDKTMIFSSKELEKATDKFSESRILGQGGQGTVYKGMLIDGRIVAVKKPKEVDTGNLEEFINEVIILSQINHRNIVKLLGCCLETAVPILVYEFIPNGNLFQHLHDQSDDFPMTWEVRLQIATEIAGALYYLHSAAAIPIYHRDVKSTNILLDEKYRAKVSDFGTSRSITIDQSHLTTLVSGTVGYVDPEYYQSGRFTDKSDVYSFGVVLVELLTGEKPVSFLRPQEDRILARYFLHSMQEDKLFGILDTQVLEQCDYEQVREVADLARRCLHLNGKMRPTMKEVASELDRNQLSQKASQVEIQKDKSVEAFRADVISSRNSFYTSSTFDCGASSSLDAETLVSLKTR